MMIAMVSNSTAVANASASVISPIISSAIFTKSFTQTKMTLSP